MFKKFYALLLLGSTALAQIDIQLNANWENPPFALRLLETVASENQSYYLQAAAKVGGVLISDEDDEEELSEDHTDKELYDSVFDLLTPHERSLYDIPLANKYYSPRVISHYKYYNDTVLPKFESKLLKKCGSATKSWVQYNDVIYCNPDDIYALLTDTKGSNEEILLPFDRVIGSSGPILVFYSDVKDVQFKPFLKNLYESAEGGKFRFVWRYIPSGNTEKEVLSGYGIDLTLKRTDYIVIDDRDLAGGNQKVLESEKVSTSDSIFDQYHDDIQAVSKADIEELDLKIASFALASENNTENFENLLKIVQDLPKYSADLSKVEIDSDLITELDFNARVGLTPQNSAIFINGLTLDEPSRDVFSLYRTIKEELKHIERLKNLGFGPQVAKEVIGKFALYSLFKNRAGPGATKRYLVESETSPIIYFNDVETDAHYASLPEDISVYLQRYQFGQIPVLKSNIHTVVFVLNLTNQDHLKLAINTVEAVNNNLIAQRIGIIPIVSSEEDQLLANNLYHLVETKGVNKAFKYLKKLETSKPKKIYEKEYIDEFVTPFVETFDVRSPSMIVNGVFYDLDENWPYSLTRQVSEDINLISAMVYGGKARSGDEIIETLFEDASTTRNSLVIPDDKSLFKYKLITHEFIEDAAKLSHKIFEFTNDKDDAPGVATITIGGNLGSKQILNQLIEIFRFVQVYETSFKVRVIHTSDEVSFIGKIRQALNTSIDHAVEVIEKILKENEFIETNTVDSAIEELLNSVGIDAEHAFILLNGRYIQLLDYVLSLQTLTTFVNHEVTSRLSSTKDILKGKSFSPIDTVDLHDWFELYSSAITSTYFIEKTAFALMSVPRYDLSSAKTKKAIKFGDKTTSEIHVLLSIDPALEVSQKLVALVQSIKDLDFVSIDIVLSPKKQLDEIPVKRFYRGNFRSKVEFDSEGALSESKFTSFNLVPEKTLFTLDVDIPSSWVVVPKESVSDLDNVLLSQSGPVTGIYELENIIIEGNAFDAHTDDAPTGLAVQIQGSDTYVMTNYGYLQLKANPGLWDFSLKEGRSTDIYSLLTVDDLHSKDFEPKREFKLAVLNLDGLQIYPRVVKNPGKEDQTLILSDDSEVEDNSKKSGFLSGLFKKEKKQADINIFTIASGHLYERLLSIMTASVMKHTGHTVKFWLIDNYMSPTFRRFLPHLAEKYGFEYELITYKWPSWLRGQREKQRTIWGYKILFLDVLFPQDLDKVIFVDADQIVRTDMKELVDLDLEGAPYGYTPMGDSREEMEGFRFWKQGYWEKFLGDQFKYHISALYVIDLKKFRQIAAGDRLRQHYQALSRDPNSLSNLDQDLPNNLQTQLRIFSLPQDWLWCETWCDDASLKTAKTIDLCNNPLTKEPKLDRARRQIPEWSVYDNEIGELHDEVFGNVQHEESIENDIEIEEELQHGTADQEHDEL